MNIFNSMVIKKHLNLNQIEEAKIYLKKSYFPTENNCYIRFNAKSKKAVLITKEELLKSLPSDLHNLNYLDDNKIKYSRTTKFMAKEYVTSCEFLDLDNYVFPIVDLSTTELMIEKKLDKNNWRFFNENGDDTMNAEIQKKYKGVKQRYINMAESLPFKIKSLNDIKMNDYEADISMINNHLFEVICSSDKPQYEYLLNFLAFTIVGHKLETALYVQSEERAGKGIFLNFINKMLGDRMYKTSECETILKYNKPFEGRVLLNFDELPQSSKKDDTLMSDKLKSLITEPTFTCRNMFEGGYVQDNTFNIIVTTNNNAISLTSQNNERYVCLDVSMHRLKDRKYFDELGTAMNKKNIKKAFYKFLLERYEKNKNVDMKLKPNSRTRNEKLAISMPSFMKYIKEKYILKNKDLNIKCTTLISNYNESYKKNISSIVVHRDLKKIDIVKKKIKENGKQETKFIASHEQLHKIFVNKHWLVVEYEDCNEDDDEEDKKEEDKKEEFISDDCIKINEYTKVLQERDILQKKIDEMMIEMKLLKAKKIDDDDDEIEDSDKEEESDDEIEETDNEDSDDEIEEALETKEEDKTPVKKVHVKKSTGKCKIITNINIKKNSLEIDANLFNKPKPKKNETSKLKLEWN